jgi:hypothetical protein
MKICRVFDHQNKSARYREALAAAGYSFTERDNCQGVRFFLRDADWRQYMMAEAAARSVPVFLYPHAARPMVQYDGPVKPQPVTAMFTQAPGGLEIMKRIDYPYPVEVTGWAYSEVRPFRPAESVKRILFAPIHPNSNGWLSQVDKDLNRKTLERLEAYSRETGAELSVRMIGTAEQNGLTFGEGTEVHAGKKNNSTADMDSADVVVGHQTFAYIAVALGIPTVMMGEDIPPRSGNSDQSFRYVEHWDDYKDELMFPLDILSGNPVDVISRACTGCDEVEDWKQRLIGEPFDGPAFVNKLEAYL